MRSLESLVTSSWCVWGMLGMLDDIMTGASFLLKALRIVMLREYVTSAAVLST